MASTSLRRSWRRLPIVAGRSRHGSAEEPPARGYSFSALVATGAAGLAGGVALERQDARARQLVRPPGFRTCCEGAITDAQRGLAEKLTGIVGAAHVRSGVDMKGSRIGRGTALCCAWPGTLEEAVAALRACVAADVAVIPQGANTALTGASVPRNGACDRPTVVLNLRRLDRVLPVGPDAQQVVCFAGAGLFDLQDRLRTESGRDSHSVLGSIFLNPSVAAGVAFGSGGTQIRKGPAFTERALWCRVLETGEVELVNTLGLKDGGNVVEFLDGRQSLNKADLDPLCERPASWPGYGESLTRFDGDVARFNADTRGIEPNRSEGKVLILATLHDTWPIPPRVSTIWVSVRSLAMAHALKREVCLSSPHTMAKSCEYFNREIYECTDQGGRLCIKAIDVLGMRPIGRLWDIKRFVETLPLPFASVLPEKVMWWLNGLFPAPLPQPLQSLGAEFDHHLLIDFAEYSEGEVQALQALLDAFVAGHPEGHAKYHVCSNPARANLFRFVMAVAFRVYCTGRGLQGLSIDYALPKAFSEYPVLPAEFPVAKRCIYSHFGCNVYHEDLVFPPDADVEAAKHAIKHAIERQGGRLPAEHGHGTEYHAPEETQKRWMSMDPLNVMNPGVGGTAYVKNYGGDGAHLLVQ